MIIAFADLFDGTASRQLREELSWWEPQVAEIYETLEVFGNRLLAACALARIWARTDVMPTLILGLTSSDPISKINASNAIGELGPLAAAAVPHLIDLLNHEEAGCFFALIALKGIGQAAAPAAPRLMNLLRTAPPEFFEVAAAEHAVNALGAIGPEAGEAIPLLKEYLAFAEDFTSVDDFFHRSLALASSLAIFQISGDEEAVLGVATKMLEDKSLCLRNDAARVLGELGAAND
jgi:HEAT repeat protein